MKRARTAFLLLLLALSAGSLAVAHFGWAGRLQGRFFNVKAPKLSAGDFPAGVAAPVEEVATVPLRPTVIGMVPRGSIASLLVGEKNLFKNSYALEVKLVAFETEDELRKAFLRGAENGGVDFAAMNVSQLAMSASILRDSAPRTVMLLGRSRGQESLVAVKGITTPAELRGKRLAAEPRSTAHYFALWVLSRAGLSMADVHFVEIESTAKASLALKEGKADAVAGYAGELEPVVRELSANVISSTVDAPHLIATVLVARGEFAARYPDAIRRVIRGVLDSAGQVIKDPSEAARRLGEVAPYLGDPTEVIKSAPPATLRENLAFFGLAGEAPVTYTEAFQSASALAVKLLGNPPAPEAQDTVELGPLKYVSTSRGL